MGALFSGHAVAATPGKSELSLQSGSWQKGEKFWARPKNAVKPTPEDVGFTARC